MIIIYIEENRFLSSDNYNNIVYNTKINLLTCPCGCVGSLHIHGYYKRYIKIGNSKEEFRICRVKCNSCGHTHAILLSLMVPYSQISLKDYITIVSNYEEHISQETVMATCPLIDENNIHYILQRYRYFKKYDKVPHNLTGDSVSFFLLLRKQNTGGTKND